MAFSADFYFTIMVVLLAGTFRGFSGFGAGMIMVPILSLVYSPLIAVITVVLLELIPVFQLLPGAISKCHWRSVIPMSLSSIVAIPFGSFLLVYADANFMRNVISIIVIICVFVLATGWRYKGEYKLTATTATGTISGLISGATSLGGLPVILYYLSGKHKTEIARATIVVFLGVTALVSLVTYSSHGIISSDIIVRTAWLAPFFILATWIGGRLFGKVSESLFRNITLLLLGSVGITMLLT